ncbi:hypothetical protein AAFF_G00264500 [Aldrovandia affinis]|uniref:Uncharacterized protein n=1 Tax=Aldrovandia affinis TaxID=143900 RepID=A0AAD7WT20_9TELE|nr:hypothetical protein AAFF_G00264500 [Aldrovandia affinis]
MSDAPFALLDPRPRPPGSSQAEPHPYRRRQGEIYWGNSERGEEEEEAFMSLKQQLVSAPALGLPDPRVPPSAVLGGRTGEAGYSTELCQKLGERYKPVGYYSTTLPMGRRRDRQP